MLQFKWSYLKQKSSTLLRKVLLLSVWFGMQEIILVNFLFKLVERTLVQIMLKF